MAWIFLIKESVARITLKEENVLIEWDLYGYPSGDYDVSVFLSIVFLVSYKLGCKGHTQD